MREIWICIHKKYSENNIFQSFNTIYLLKMLKTICNSKDKILRNGEDCFSTSHFFNNSAKSNTTLRGLLFSLFFVTHLTTSACRSSAPIKQKPKHVQFPYKKRKTTKLWKERFLLQLRLKIIVLIQKVHVRRYSLYTKHRSLHPFLFVNCRFLQTQRFSKEIIALLHWTLVHVPQLLRALDRSTNTQ